MSVNLGRLCLPEDRSSISGTVDEHIEGASQTADRKTRWKYSRISSDSKIVMVDPFPV